MDVTDFSEIAEEFDARVKKIVWCTVSTIDRQGRPRSRILHPIWEGTTNVLSLDTLRAMRETNGLEPIQVELQRCCDSLQDPALVALAKTTLDSFSAANTWLMESMGQASELEGGARRFAMTLGRCLSLALLLEHAQWSIDQNDDRLPLYAAQRYAAAGINQIRDLSSDAAFALANA